MDFETITVESNNAVGVITLNRPASMNAVCAAMLYELAQAISDFDAEESIRVIVLKGESDFLPRERTCLNSRLPKTMRLRGAAFIPAQPKQSRGAANRLSPARPVMCSAADWNWF